jgi:hypothetical protein
MAADEYSPDFDDTSTVYAPEAQGAKIGPPDLIAFLAADELEWLRDAKGLPWGGSS